MDFSKGKGEGLTIRSGYEEAMFIVSSQHIGTTVTRGLRMTGVDERDEPILTETTIVDPAIRAETVGKYVQVDAETGSFTAVAPAEIVVDEEGSAIPLPDAVVTEVIPMAAFDRVAADRDTLTGYIHRLPASAVIPGNQAGY